MVYREFVGLQDLSLIQTALADGVEIRSRLFSHDAPQSLVHMQDELSAFGMPLRGEWQIVAEVTPVHDDE